MERQLEIIAYLLAKLVSVQNGCDAAGLLEEAKEATEPEPKGMRIKSIAVKVDKEAVDRIYALYPTKCPVSGRSLGKSHKDKNKIEIILRDMPEATLAEIIKRYIKETTEQRSYMKNFATFLNNLPDYSDTIPEEPEQDNQPPVYTMEDIYGWYPKLRIESDEEYKERIDYIVQAQRKDGVIIIDNEN